MAAPALAAVAELASLTLAVVSASKKTWNSLGSLQDDVYVKVSGAPGASKSRLYFLAASIAFSLVKRLNPAVIPPAALGALIGFGPLGSVAGWFGVPGVPLPPPGAIGIEYDAAGNEVVFTIKYNQALASILVLGAGAAALNNIPLYKGPPQAVIGSAWGFAALPIPGGIGGIGGPALPVLEFNNQVAINGPTSAFAGAALPLATDPTADVRPSGDSRSRGSLVWLVSQSLATPPTIATQTYLQPTPANKFTGG
jgi:hypothetical protein